MNNTVNVKSCISGTITAAGFTQERSVTYTVSLTRSETSLFNIEVKEGNNEVCSLQFNHSRTQPFVSAEARRAIAKMLLEELDRQRWRF